MPFRRMRVAIVLWAIVIFSGLCAPSARAQQYDTLFQKAVELQASGKKQDALAEYTRVATEQQANPEAAAEALYRGIAYAEGDYGATPADKAQGHEAAIGLWKQLAEKYPRTQGMAKAADIELKRAASLPRTDALGEYNRFFGDLRGKNPDLAAEALYEEGLYASQPHSTNPDDVRNDQDQAFRVWKQIGLDYPDTAAARKLSAPSDGAPQGAYVALERRLDKRNSTDWKYQILAVLVKLTGGNPAYSYAIALILLAVIVKLLTFPLTLKQYAGMREMQQMQPLMKELQKKYKGPELNAKMMELYKEHGVNPLAGCWPMLIQMPFLIFIYRAVQEYEYAFAQGKFIWIGSTFAAHSTSKLWGHNVFGHSLAEPDVPLLILYSVTMYISTRLTPATDPQQQQQQATMALMMSGLFFYMFLSNGWSSAFVLYWLALNILQIWQSYEYIYKPHKAKQLAGGGPNLPGPEPSPSSNGAGRSIGGATPIAGSAPARVKPRKKKR